MSSAYQTGLRLSSQGRHFEAIAQFEQALAQSPGDTKVLFALGNTAGQLGLGPVAEQFYRQVLALEPSRLEAIVNLANLLRTAGQFDAAIALLEPALALRPPLLQCMTTSLLLSISLRRADNSPRGINFAPGIAPCTCSLGSRFCTHCSSGELSLSIVGRSSARCLTTR